MVGDFEIIRSDRFVTIANAFLRDKNLSNKAKGVLAMILALPPKWDFSIKGMVAITKDGEACLRAAINEMKENGYCAMKPVRINNKIARWKYLFSGDKLSEKQLCDFLKVEKLKVENQAQYNNELNSSSTNTPTDLNKEKSVSNDIQKAEEETGLSFNDFYKLYPLKKSKQQAEKSWNRLSKADRQEAIDKLPAYIADCIQEKRSFKHPSTYLNQRTWEDDFTTHSKVSFYDALPTDSEQEKKFKNWMRTSYPNIENTALPLSYGDFMSLYTDFGTEEIKNQLEVINANIGKYKYSDINAIIRGNLEDI